MSLLRAALVGLFALALTAFATPTADAAKGGQPGREFTTLQMNLCLSGYAGCYGGTQYPKIIDEAVATIEATKPDAVTVNEACSGDLEQIAERTDYKLEFATVIYNGAPLACKNPTGRGYFGNAVLTKVAVKDSEQAPFASQSGAEQRRWICVTTRQGVNVCTTHLAVGATSANQQAQCTELEGVLARKQEEGPTFFGGDMNRQTDCAPEGMWVMRDDEARQLPGIQHLYGPATGGAVTEQVIPATYTDHDFILATSVLAPKGHR